MVTTGLLVRLEAQHGQEAELEDFLRSAQGLVAQEPATTAWFAVRFGRLEYGIFDVFPDEAGRQAHLAGAVAAQLMGPGRQLLARDPQIQRLDLLALHISMSCLVAAGAVLHLYFVYVYAA